MAACWWTTAVLLSESQFALPWPAVLISTRDQSVAWTWKVSQVDSLRVEPGAIMSPPRASFNLLQMSSRRLLGEPRRGQSGLCAGRPGCRAPRRKIPKPYRRGCLKKFHEFCSNVRRAKLY